jgi:magnesium transporter
MLTAYTCHQRTLSETHKLDSDEGLFWVDLMTPLDEEEKATEDRFGIDIPTREELAEIEVSSRLYQEDNAAFMTATVVHRGTDDRAETSPVTFILKGGILITVRYAEPRAFPLFIRQLQRPGHCPITGEAALIGILEAIIDRAADHLEATSAILDQISRSVFKRRQVGKPTSNTKRFQDLVTSIGEQGDFVSKMRESFITLGRMVAYLSVMSETIKRASKAENQVRLTTLRRDIQALADHATFLSNKISFLLDAVLGMVHIEQNAIIKIFSVAAVVFLPPTLVASLYGMNFAHMPELNWIYGYPTAIALMVLSGLLPYYFFKQRGWL